MNRPSQLTADRQVQEVLKPILYADIFDYPLTFDEIYKFLEVEITPEMVEQLLYQALDEKIIVQIEDVYCLSNRHHLVSHRKERQKTSKKMWPGAIRYGKWIGSLPFVRLVAVTGALAVNNPRDGIDDIDYLIVTQPGRLWLCRAMIILMVKYGHRRGIHLCPNYIITENVLEFENDFFTARQLLQMQPVYGKEHYLEIHRLNAWIKDYFPHGNNSNSDDLHDSLSSGQQALKKSSEFLLRGALGNFIEKHLQRIQVTKHTRLAAEVGAQDKVIFNADVCKGHYHSHNHKTMNVYRERLQDYMAGVNGALPNGKTSNLGVEHD